MKNATFKIISFLFLIWNFSCFAGKNQLHIGYSKSDVTCFNKTDGKIELTIIGGKEPYQILWNNGSNELKLENLAKGNYIVEVIDAIGNETEEYIVIGTPSPLSISFDSKTATKIDGLAGSINASIQGGSPWEVEANDFYFLRLNGESNFQSPLDLKDGIYELSIEDASGCSLSVQVNIDFELEGEYDFTKVNSTTSNNTKYNGLGNVKVVFPASPVVNQMAFTSGPSSL